MKVVVLGLGYVGTVCAACLARDGFEVVGVDVNEQKARAVEEGRSPILEPGVDDLVREGRRTGRLRAAVSLTATTRDADMYLICVGTPSSASGASDLSHLSRALVQLGESLRGGTKFQVVNVRSTVPPGVLHGHVQPLLEERSGRRVGETLGLAMNPEFLREGSSIRDYDSAPYDICGTSDDRTADAVRALYAAKGRPFHATRLETAAMAKYVCNAFHALKVTFANEVGRLSKGLQVDSLEVMRLVCEDKRLNISPAYLRPGMAFGGSCLPKDLRALVHESRRANVTTPLLEAILSSNDTHVRAALDRILGYGRPRTALLGLSFKAGTDDLRESAMVLLAEGLLGKGVPLRIYDRNVHLSSLVGANRDYIQREIPHLGTLLVPDLTEAVRDAEVVVVGTDDPEMDQVPGLLGPRQVLIDLFGRLAGADGAKVGGICW